MTPRRIFISVAEDSADVHAASLVCRTLERRPDCEFYGLTGPRLRAAGAETVYDFAAHAAMLAGVPGVLRQAHRALQAVSQSWRQRRPDLVVLVDSPELHLRLARRAKELGLPVLYYIAPQTWASREYRVRQIVRYVDRLACILPFEEAYFRAFGISAEYVGHPLFEVLARQAPIPDTVAFLKSRAAGRPIIALLPGSREHVIRALLPRQLEVITQLRTSGTPAYAAISCVSEQRRAMIRNILAGSEPLMAQSPDPSKPADLIDAGIDLVVDDNASLLSAADLVLVASGTATLEVAHHRKPMVVMYDAGRLLKWPHRLLGRRCLLTPHLALVNVLAGTRVVPEFMPFVPDVRPIAQVARQLLTDADWRTLMIRQLDELVSPLEPSQASARVGEIMDELLAHRSGSGKTGP